MYARELSGNEGTAQALRSAARVGVPIYAECGGLMYLGQSLVDLEGARHKMAGLIPARSSLSETRLTLGYRTVRALSDGPMLKRGQQMKGHEFHWSRLEEGHSDGDSAYEISEGGGRREGVQSGSVLASYVHIPPASDPNLAPRFVQECAAVRERLS